MKAIISKTKYVEAIGRRKEAVARVRLTKGDGRLLINNQKLENYFGDILGIEDLILAPLILTKSEKEFDISAQVRGGGKKAQAEAARLGIARALLKIDESLKPTLRKAGFLTRDPRQKERKKFGLKGARRAPQWSKR